MYCCYSTQATNSIPIKPSYTIQATKAAATKARKLPLPQDETLRLYTAQAVASQNLKKRGAHVQGFGYGFATGLMMFVVSLVFWFGGRLVKEQTIEYKDFLVAFFTIFFAMFGASEVWMS